MTTTVKRLVSGSALTGSAATYYTAAGLRAVIKAAVLVNTTGGAIAATVHLVPNGGTADATNTAISAKSIAAGETYNCPELVNQVLEVGGTIQALGNGLTLIVSGVEIS